MFQRLRPKPQPSDNHHPSTGGPADRHRDRMAKRSRLAFSEVSDIGDIPPVKNPVRREACRLDLRRYLATYFPHSTGQGDFSEEQNRPIGRIEHAGIYGGNFLSLFPRGFAKSTISENSALWLIKYGHRRFVPIFGSSGDAASKMIDSIKLELSENDLLLEDFPEVCYPIRKLEGRVQRCKSQHHAGSLTHIEWTAGKIVLPIIAGSVASGAVVEAHGIESATRGMKHKLPDGTQLRPDFAIVDDPQTDESARSPVQISKRLNVLQKNILKLGGHSKRIAVVVNATVIEPNDMVEQMTDRKRFPSWQFERIKTVKQWANKDAHENLWLGEYATLRNTFDPLLVGDKERAETRATDFYIEHRAEMDAGCVVTWETGPRDATEISAIQHAYNMFIDDGPEVFASECQNEPLADAAQGDGLTPDQILTSDRFNQVPLGRVPEQYTRLVGHIDVQGNVLFWLVLALDDNFGSAVVDFGTWPKVDRAFFTLADVRKSLRAETGADSDAAAVKIAVQRCAGELFAREWRQGERADGAVMPLEKLGVDANDGDVTDEIYQACRDSEHREKLVPTHGRGITVKSLRKLEDTKLQLGDRGGLGWRFIRNVARVKRGMPYLLIDTNRWKTFAEKQLQKTPGGPGSLMLNGRLQKIGGELRVPDRFRMLGAHWTAERCLMVEADGRTASEWDNPRREDQHWWDNLVACFVIANLIGVREPTAGVVVRAKPKSFAESRAAAGTNPGSRPAGGYAKFRRGGF